MKHLFKLSLVGFLPLSLFSFTSCSKAYYLSAKHLAPYFHEITYSGYEEDTKFETLTYKEANTFDFGCTAIRNGNIYGRNYDYYYSNSPSILVKMQGSQNRLKSVGMANHLNINEDELVNLESSKRDPHTINIIPNFMLDGINEKGVVCNMNIVDFDDGGGRIVSTNPGKKKLFVFFALRYILDNATSAANAIDLLKDRDIFTLEDGTTSIHFMIADINETYIVEFITKNGATELRANKKEGNEQIMTNFYNNMSKVEALSTYKENPGAYDENKNYDNNASGTERYEFVLDHYDDCSSAYGMWSILHEIRFSNMYHNPNKPDWPSEDFSQEEIYKAGKDFTDPTLLATYRDIYNLTRYVLDTGRRDLGPKCDTWITMHNEIYNIEEKTLSVNVQEDYLNTYNYDLNF